MRALAILMVSFFLVACDGGAEEEAEGGVETEEESTQ